MRVVAITIIFLALTGPTAAYANQRKAAPKASIAAKPAMNWEVSSAVDAVSDTTSYSASKRGDAGLLSIGCKKGQKDSFTVLVGSDTFLGSNRVGMRELTYRLDNQSPVEGRWAYSGRAAMLTNTDQSTKILIPMMTATHLLVRMYAYDGTSKDINFDVTGVAETAKKLLGSCEIGQR